MDEVGLQTETSTSGRDREGRQPKRVARRHAGIVALVSMTTRVVWTKRGVARAEEHDESDVANDGGTREGPQKGRMPPASSSGGEEKVPKKKKSTRERIEELELLEEQQLEREQAISEQNRQMAMQDSTIDGLQRQLELKNELIALLKRERNEAKEEMKLAQGLCGQSAAIF